MAGPNNVRTVTVIGTTVQSVPGGVIGCRGRRGPAGVASPTTRSIANRANEFSYLSSRAQQADGHRCRCRRVMRWSSAPLGTERGARRGGWSSPKGEREGCDKRGGDGRHQYGNAEISYPAAALRTCIRVILLRRAFRSPKEDGGTPSSELPSGTIDRGATARCPTAITAGLHRPDGSHRLSSLPCVEMSTGRVTLPRAPPTRFDRARYPLSL